MEDKIQLFRQEPFEISNVNWYLLTQTNYEIDGRKLYCKRHESVELNPYFLFDKFKDIKDFNIYYLAAFSDVENFNEIDFDFEVGFNNLGLDYEKECIGAFKLSDNDIYVIIRPKIHTKDFYKTSKLFNQDSNEYIEKIYKVIYKNIDKVPTYIIKLDNLNQLSTLEEYIYGYLINIITNEKNDFNSTTAFYDLEEINNLMENFEYVILRTSIYANYNLTIYTRCKNITDIRNELIQYSNKMKIEFEETNNVSNKL